MLSWQLHNSFPTCTLSAHALLRRSAPTPTLVLCVHACMAAAVTPSHNRRQQVAVAVFHRMKAGKHADMGDAAQHFARALHDYWGVGNPDCQNGALLLLAVGDRQVRLTCGCQCRQQTWVTRLDWLHERLSSSRSHWHDCKGCEATGCGLSLCCKRAAWHSRCWRAAGCAADLCVERGGGTCTVVLPCASSGVAAVVDHLCCCCCCWAGWCCCCCACRPTSAQAQASRQL